MVKRILIFSLVLVLTVVTFTTALAQNEPEVLACPDGTVSGVIVAYDEETGVVTLDVEGVLCTVTLNSDYDHPITDLLGAYFSEIDLEEIADALETLQVCAVFDGEIYTVTEPDENGECAEGELVTVIGEGEEGGFEALTESDEVITFEPEDEEAADALTGALDNLQADWEVEDGGIGDVGDEIGGYHEDGYGFGVLVKVYAIYDEAQQACEETPEVQPALEGEVDEKVVDEATEEIDPCDVSIELLLESLEDMGLGQLFQVYGKPAIMGIGHVRNIGEGGGSDGDGDGDGSSGICNARANGGNANATGQPNISCDDVDTQKEKDKDDGGDGEGDG
jgi:hypothetical protein